jgi:hypothetical protein
MTHIASKDITALILEGFYKLHLCRPLGPEGRCHRAGLNLPQSANLGPSRRALSAGLGSSGTEFRNFTI